MRDRRGHLADVAQPGHVQQFGLQFLHPAFMQLPLSQVADETGEEPPTAGNDLADGQLHGEGGAILAPPHHDAADADDSPLPRLHVMTQIAVMPLPIRRRHQDAHILAHGLFGREAEQPLCRRAVGLDQAAIVDDDDRVGGGFENRLQARLPLLQRAANHWLTQLIFVAVHKHPSKGIPGPR
jgi:hypothetical protein